MRILTKIVEIQEYRQADTRLSFARLQKINFERKAMFIPTLNGYVHAYEGCGKVVRIFNFDKNPPSTKISLYNYKSPTLTGDLFSKLFRYLLVKAFVTTSRFDDVVSFRLLGRVHFNEIIPYFFK